jgi:hypothetical protein
MFCFFRTCVEENPPKVPHNRNVRFNDEVNVIYYKITSPNISSEKTTTDVIEKEEPIFTLS